MGMSVQLKGCDSVNPDGLDSMSWLAQATGSAWTMWTWWPSASAMVTYFVVMTTLCVAYWCSDARQLGLFGRLDSHARWLRWTLFFEPLLGLCRALAWREIRYLIRKFIRDGQEKPAGDAMTALTKVRNALNVFFDSEPLVHDEGGRFTRD